MDIRLISFDLDGTFLDDGKGIPPAKLRRSREGKMPSLRRLATGFGAAP